jgi:hypothetical protein
MPKLQVVLNQLSDMDISYEQQGNQLFIPDSSEPDFTILVDEEAIHVSFDGVESTPYDEATFSDWLNI